MRLIDADELRAKYQAILDRGDMFCEYDIIGMLDNAPTVEYPEAITIKCDTEEDKQKLVSALRNASARLEVRAEEERPHGHWIFEDDGRGLMAACSECKAITLSTHGNYCPNCGADMRGGKNETD